MMNYEIFKEVVAEKFMDYLPAQYQGMKVDVHPVEKVNVTMDAINLLEEGAGISPTIYINDMYDHYKSTEDLQEVLQSAAERMERAMKEAPEIVPALDMQEAKDNIVFQLINTEQNRDMLLDTPNRKFQDLSVIYRWVVKSDMDGIQSTVVRNALAERLGFTEEQMFKLAVENTRRMFPPTVKSMNDVIRDICELLHVSADYLYFGTEAIALGQSQERKDYLANMNAMLAECGEDDLERLEQMMRLFFRK